MLRVCLTPSNVALRVETNTASLPTGKTVNHAFAKEVLAGFVGAEVDKLAETKGEDAWDSFEAKRKAKHNAEQMYDQHYGQDDEYNPDQRPPPQQFEGRW